MVQGVGFRPYIYRLAIKHGLTGKVENRTDGVTIIIQGDAKDIDLFIHEVQKNTPPASYIKSVEVFERDLAKYSGFFIAESSTTNKLVTEISPDIAVCDECMADLSSDPARISYPFVNCTNCGPRFTIIGGLPYDRSRTTMKDFAMCSKCKSEYNDVLDRRFHAQPIACNNCGPAYRLIVNGKVYSGIDRILAGIASYISAGQILAIKGLGGYHLMCDALNEDAVTRLRKRKQRDAKPFAVMFGDIKLLSEYCYVTEHESKQLFSWQRRET